MSITFTNGVWVANFDYDNRHIPKSAGFLWHPEPNGPRCRPNCKGCKAGLVKKWWTPFPEKAAVLIDHCDDAAKQALGPHLAKTEASKAVDADLDLAKPDGLEYLPYQKAGIAYALGRKGTLFADEMGLGKTIQALGVINNDREVKSTLVLCPASLRLNWLRESKRWLTDRRNVMGIEEFFYVVDSPKAVPATACFVICNYDRLNNDVLRSLMGREWDCLIVDEAHYLKDPKAQRTKKVFGISAKWKKQGNEWIQTKPRVDGIVDRVGRRIMLLTGTPILNRPIETFPLLQALDPKTWGSAFKFAKAYCNAHHNGYGYDYTGANKARLGELQERLRATIMVRRLKKDVLKELPAKRRQVVVLPPNGASGAVKAEQDAWKAHQERIEELEQVANLAHASGDESAYKAAVEDLNNGIRHAFTEIAAARKAVALAKVDKVVEHVQNMQESGIEKIIVWAHHHEVTDKLVAALGAMRADGRDTLNDRQAVVDAFQNDPNPQIIVCGIRAMGEGHTLTAASNVVFAELDWVPAKMSQCEDRAHRIGQTESVLVQHLVLDQSLDATMAHALVEKQDIADLGLDAPTSLNVSVVPSKKGNRPAKYPVPTDAEREHAAGAVQLLAAMCDGACSEDHQGFNKLDTNAGKQLAARSTQRLMTDGEVFFAKKLARKYRRQLPQKFWEVLDLNK